ncbi:MAG: hypothetical protein SFW66_09355 [Gammaproteobacteria bacterium]|nr:hypothetical protein [Gammaproteobacteria bacterium]
MRNYLYASVRYVAALIVAGMARYYFLTLDCVLILLVTLFVMQVSPDRVFFRSMSRFLIVLLIAILVLFIFQANAMFRHLVSVISIGGLSGLFINYIVFPIQVNVLFREFILSSLGAYRAYFLAIMSDRVVQQDALEAVWLHWPFWVGRRYIDTKLRPGHHFFLQKLGQACDVLFSLHSLSVDIKNNSDYIHLHEDLLSCTQQFDRCFAVLTDKVNAKQSDESFPDMKDVLTVLEKNYRERIPLPIEGLEMRRDAVMIAHFICGLEDLYWLLMKMSESLAHNTVSR